jgi:hypothetical protein
MLSERDHYKELVLELERCNAACFRFNNSTNPDNGVSPMERARGILHPRVPIQISLTLASPVTNVGHLSDRVVVELPFFCDYEYNIIIGHNVQRWPGSRRTVIRNPHMIGQVQWGFLLY